MRNIRTVLLALATVAAVVATAAGASAGVGTARYIVQLSDPSLASYRGGITGLDATNPTVRGEVKLNPDSAASKAYLNYLAKKHADFLTAAGLSLGRAVSAIFDYRYAFNGVAVSLAEAEAAKVASVAGVSAVYPEETLELHTDAGPAWIGAPAVWSGSGGGAATKGEGIVAGVIDTGVNHDHPSFADVGGDGYNHTNPRGRFYGQCDPVTGKPFCNDKLIGVYDFTGTSPEDDNQHGSHTASTVAGNAVSATIYAPTLTATRNISGVAPHANLITYKGCIPAGCVNVSTVAAIDQATADGVDVINFSIGGGSRDPWSDPNSLAFLGARDAGVFVNASAGNSGPGAETMGSPANAPWLMAVGASTHNRKLANKLTSMSGGGATPPADMEGKSFTSGYGPAAIVDAADYGDALCGAPFAPGTFKGEIVVCTRGVNPRVEKGRNVKLGGAGGMVLANSAADGESTVADGHELPAVHIGYTAGQTLKSWLASGSGHTAAIAGTTFDTAAANGDIMAGFSSRGPDKTVPAVLKPDVTAPGVDVLAAVHTLGNASALNGPEYGVLSGTSMSGPHASGAAALVRALHRNWTPADVQSALMTTALTSGVRKEDGVRPANPFDYGAGRVDLTRAGLAGLVLRETGDKFLAADPEAGGDPTTLNLPSLANGDCEGKCSWTRVVTSTLAADAAWTVKVVAPRGVAITVSPDRFTLPPGGSQTLTVTADVARAPTGKWLFGELRLATKGGAPAAHLPIAVLPGGSPTPVNIETASSTGTHSVTVTSNIDITRFSSRVSGLAEGKVVNEQVVQDPTMLEPYDTPVGTVHTLVNVPAGSRLLAAEVTDTTSSDVDLFVGIDSDKDGQPDESEEVCRSASEIAIGESCRLKDPAGGSYWVMVQNWLLGQPPADDVELVVSVVPGTDNGNLSVSAPQTVPAGQPFTIGLAWNEPAMNPGSTWFALVEYGADAKRPSNAGSLLVRISRTS